MAERSGNHLMSGHVGLDNHNLNENLTRKA